MYIGIVGTGTSFQGIAQSSPFVSFQSLLLSSGGSLYKPDCYSSTFYSNGSSTFSPKKFGGKILGMRARGKVPRKETLVSITGNYVNNTID